MRGDPAIQTYRYLRLGLVGGVVLLAASILIERAEVDCWQTSVSGYYYTHSDGSEHPIFYSAANGSYYIPYNQAETE